MTLAEAARIRLRREEGSWSVMQGDSHLLHEINALAGRPARGHKTERCVLSALDRSPMFTKSYVRVHLWGRYGWREALVRRFELREEFRREAD